MQALGFSRPPVLRVHRKWVDSVKLIPVRSNFCGQQRVDEWRHRRLPRIITADRRAIVTQITLQFNTGTQQRVSSYTIQNHVLPIEYRSHRHTKLHLQTAHHRAQSLVLALEHCHWKLEMCKNVVYTYESRSTFLHADERI